MLVRTEQAGAVLDLARRLHACSPAVSPAETRVARGARGEERHEARALVTMQVPNARVGELVEGVRELAEDAQVVVMPGGALPLRAPLDDAGEQVRDVSQLSTFEVVLASLQSVGSWRGLLVYSALAGIIGAYGVVLDASYLLVAAMLINPMAAPALVSVVAIAIGDARMAGRGALRFAISLGVQTLAALGFGLLYGLTTSTAMMEQVTSLSRFAVLVAVAAGAAGAQTLVKSERDSLVSGTAAGFMVAAALAPPAAVLGLSIPLARWDYAGQMGLLLALQYFAIVIGGVVASALNGVRPSAAALGRGSEKVRGALIAASVLVTAVLVALQVTRGPALAKGDLSRRALEEAQRAVEPVAGAAIVEVSAHFTRPELSRHEGETVLVDVVVERTDPTRTPEDVERDVRDAVRSRLTDAMRGVVPLVDVTVLPGPAAQDAGRG